MTSSSSLLSKANALATAGKTILPLACAATASAASLNFDFFGSGLFDNSGWFVSTLTVPSSGGGITQGTGFKLHGTDSITDSAFYRYDNLYGQTVPRSDGDGLALLWGGSITGSLLPGDILSAPFDLNYAFTHIPAGPGDTYISNDWKLTLGLVKWNGAEPLNWAVDASNSGFGSIITSTNTSGYESAAGSYSRTGEIGLTVEEWMTGSDSPSHWFVRLEVLVNHENGYHSDWDTKPKLNGDTLTVTVPQNSIDISYLAIPEPSSVMMAAAGGMMLLRRRRNS
jgi:hypothetical protein